MSSLKTLGASLSYAMITALWLGSGPAALCAHSSARADRPSQAAWPTRLAAIEERWGIQIVFMRLSAAGYMLDFRYRVTDPEKAALLGDRRVRAYLIHQDSGAKMVVPAPAKIGPLRQTARQLKSGRTYFMFFANPGRLVKPGDTVTVVIGKFRVENLVVQGLGEAPQTVQMKEII